MNNCWLKIYIKGMTMNRQITWKYVVCILYERVRNAPGWGKSTDYLCLKDCFGLWRFISCNKVSFSRSFFWRRHVIPGRNQPPKFYRPFMGTMVALVASIAFQQRRSTCKNSRGLFRQFLQWWKYNICSQKKLYCGGGAWRDRGEILERMIFRFFRSRWLGPIQVTNVVSSTRLNIACVRPFTR